MKLIKITKKGSLHFNMSDGRLGVSYETGYIRVSVKGLRNRLYQINPVKVVELGGTCGIHYMNKRILIPSQIDRLNALLEFNNKNCK